MTKQDSILTRRQVLRGATGMFALGAVGGLAGCGGSGGSSGQGVSISAWYNQPQFKEPIDTILVEFTKDNPGIKVDMSYKPTAQYPTLLKTALVGNAAPDSFATAGASGIFADVGAGGGYLLPLDGSLQLDALRPGIRAVVQYQGHTYGAPLQFFKGGIYYQRPIFDKYGLQPPDTWDDLRTLSKTLSQHGIAAWVMPAQDMVSPFIFYHLAVNSILGAAGYEELRTGKRKLTDADLLPAAQLLVDLVPYYNDGFQGIGYVEAKGLFAQGRAAMTVGGSSDYAGYAEINPKVDVGFCGFPSPTGSGRIAYSGLSAAFVVNKKSTHPDEAIAFASWLTGDKAQRLVLQHLGLPAREGITPDGDDARSKLLSTMLEVPDSPYWLDYPETAGTVTAAVNGGGGLFTKRVSPQQFCELLQGSIKAAS